MPESASRFLAAAAICVAVVVAAHTLSAGQQRRPIMPTPPSNSQPKDEQNTADDESKPNPQTAKRAQLLQNEKEFRDGVERLYQLSGELRDELQQTPNTQVFSVHMYKKAEEIERLAKQLKGKAKGG